MHTHTCTCTWIMAHVRCDCTLTGAYGATGFGPFVQRLHFRCSFSPWNKVAFASFPAHTNAMQNQSASWCGCAGGGACDISKSDDNTQLWPHVQPSRSLTANRWWWWRRRFVLTSSGSCALEPSRGNLAHLSTLILFRFHSFDDLTFLTCSNLPLKINRDPRI